MKKSRVTASKSCRAFGALSGAGVAFLLAGNAEAGSNVTVYGTFMDYTLVGDADGEGIMLALTTEGKLVYRVFSNVTDLGAFEANPLNYGTGFAVTGGGEAIGVALSMGTLGTAASFGLFAKAVNADILQAGPIGIPAVFVDQLAYWDLIGPSPLLGSPNLMTVDGWSPAPEWSGSGYIGFSVLPDGGVNTYYGWAHISDLVDATSATISGFGLKIAANTAIHAGEYSHSVPRTTTTPEPVTGGLALLALGAAGVMRHKRRRETAA